MRDESLSHQWREHYLVHCASPVCVLWLPGGQAALAKPSHADPTGHLWQHSSGVHGSFTTASKKKPAAHGEPVSSVRPGTMHTLSTEQFLHADCPCSF